MAIILDLQEYRTRTGLASDTARDAALELILNDVNNAINLYLRNPLEQVSRTEYIDAPATDRIVLRYWPVVTITSVKVAYMSNGDPSKFTSDTLWDQYTDWILEVDESDGSSRCGVLRATQGYWSVNYRRPPGRLTSRLDPDFRAVQIVYVAGYLAIPSSLKTAAQIMTSRIFNSRLAGFSPGSASLNGGSYSLQSAAGEAGMLLGDPTVESYLKPFHDIWV